MRVHPWMFWLCSLYWLCLVVLLHYCIDWYVCISPTVSMSTSYCHSLHLPVCLYCYYDIDLACITDLSLRFVLLHCIVYLHIPLSLQWVPVYISSPHLHVCLWYFSCRKDTLFAYCHCIVLLVYWHWHFLLIICLLPQLLRAVAPAPTLINTF